MAKLLTLPIARVQDANGVIYPGAKLYAYLTTTTTPASVYTSSALSVAHANPVVADAGGFLPAIYLDASVTYRFVVKTSAGAAITGMDFDPVASIEENELRLSTADYPLLTTACAAAVATGLPLLVNASRSLTANLSTTARLIPGGGIITTGSHTLTVGAIDGPEIPLFDKAGTGAITLSSGTSWLGWFSPTGDGVTADTNPVTRWVNSSPKRSAGLLATYLTDTVALPTQGSTASTLIGAGINVTNFKSKTGADVFTLPGVNILGLNYVNFLTMGGMTFLGQGPSTGSGYGVHVPSSVSTGYKNRFFDMDCDQMGGGAFKDEAGLFNTIWEELRGGGSGGHLFDMHGGGPASVMYNCYPRDLRAGKAGFRVIYQQLILRDCNALAVNTDALSFWLISGSSTSSITINVTSGGTVTIPAGAVNVSANTTLEHCNIEAFPDVAILAINGTVRMDESSVFQTKASKSNCIAIYCTNSIGLGLQGTIPPVGNFSLGASSSWANSCPIWVHDTTAAFFPPIGDGTNKSIAVYDYTDAVTITLSALGAEHAGVTSVGRMEPVRAKGLWADMMKLTPQTPASSSATCVAGEIMVDANYIYVGTAANTLKRSALTTW